MQQNSDPPAAGPGQIARDNGPSTQRVTESGQAFTTHQRPDRRWFFRIDGQDSTQTYPTAGEAERGALLALASMRKKRLDSWKLAPLLLAVSAPVLYLLWMAYRFVSGR